MEKMLAEPDCKRPPSYLANANRSLVEELGRRAIWGEMWPAILRNELLLTSFLIKYLTVVVVKGGPREQLPDLCASTSYLTGN